MTMVWKLLAVIVFSVSEKTKFEVDTTSIILSYLYHYGNVNRELFRYYLSPAKTPHDKINKILSQVTLVENFRKQRNLDCITVTKSLKCFRTSGFRKWRNRLKTEKFVVLAEYFEQQTDCSLYWRELANQGEVLRGGISRIYLSLSNKWMETMLWSYQQSAT